MYLCVILYHILCVYFVFLCDILLPSGVINDDKLLQTAVMRAAAALVMYQQYSVPTHPSPQRSSTADRSAPLGRRVSGNGVLLAGCTK